MEYSIIALEFKEGIADPVAVGGQFRNSLQEAEQLKLKLLADFDKEGHKLEIIVTLID